MRSPRQLALGLALVGLAVSACGGDEPTAGPEGPCASTVPYSVGESVMGSLASTDCVRPNGSFIDFYAFSVAGQQSVLFTLDSDDFDAVLWLIAGTRTDGPPVALANDVSETNSNAAIHIVMSGGSYIAGANSFAANESGSYTLGSAIVPESVTGCAEAWVTRAITTSQTIDELDCEDESGLAYFDGFLLIVQAGQTVTVTQTSPDFDPRLTVSNSSGSITTSDTGEAGGPGAQVSFTTPTNDIFILEAGTAAIETTGAYTIEIS